MEVVTALSVISFALVGLLGVLPIGIDNARTSVSETRAAQLSRMVFSTLRSEPFHAAPCFGTNTLDLSTLSTFEEPTPEILYVSYGTYEEPRIVRTNTAPADAIYRLEMRFRPEVFTSANASRPTGSTVRLRMTGLNAQQGAIFETSAFIGRYQRVAFAK